MPKSLVVLWVAVVLTVCVRTEADVFNMPSGQTSLEFVTVGDPGNRKDTQIMWISDPYSSYPPDHTSGYGSVDYIYRIGKYEITGAQYCQFLNAVAKTDPYGLYGSGMSITNCISRAGTSGNYSYSVILNPDYPVYLVSWGDAARFCNWLHNGQPTNGIEDSTTTEDGAYTLSGAITDSALMAITRNTDAQYYIPSENEWYKAAYYNGGGLNAGYQLYATPGTPGNTPPDGANYNTPWVTCVGAYTSSPGPYGTFDQSGNLIEWNEAIVSEIRQYRGLRGGYWHDPSVLPLSAMCRQGYLPTYDAKTIGFRVASVPEPGSLIMLVGLALTALLCYWCKHV